LDFPKVLGESVTRRVIGSYTLNSKLKNRRIFSKVRKVSP
jgi:hypothetical protein